MVDHTERVLDEELLRAIARRLGRLTHVETVSVFPREKPESVVAVLDDQYYPATLREMAGEARLYDDGAFYITYREDWGGESWMCRWDRHDNPHSTRDHYHEPPEARTEDAIDQEYPSDTGERLGGDVDELVELELCSRLGALVDDGVAPVPQ